MKFHKLSLNIIGSWLISSLSIASELSFSQQEFVLPAESERIVIADLNGDKLNDLIITIDQVLRVYFHREDGFDFVDGYDEITFSSVSVGWDLSTNYNDSGKVGIVALINGKDVMAWHAENEIIQEPKTIKTGLPGFLSKGVNRLFFSRDINGDGKEDLVIPGAGNLNLFVANDGGYESGFTIKSNSRVRTVLQSSDLERQIGQGVRIPFMELRDLNNDGLEDLISRTDENFDVFIADRSSTSYFENEPSYSIDINEIEERLGDFDIDNLDFSNLTGILSITHEEILDDVTGDAIDDLLLREGGKITLFEGTATGMELENPKQVLRSGGNVLTAFLYDENEDSLKDLWLWRVEPISVGDVFIWLALSGSIAVEAFIYPNNGERFSRRPTRKITVNLRFPSVIRLANSFQVLAGEARENQTEEIIPTRAGHFDDILTQEDIVLMIDDQVQIFLNSITPDPKTQKFLGPLGYSREINNYEINLRDMLNATSLLSNPHLDATSENDADISIGLKEIVINGDIALARLNDDSVDDVFVFTQHDSSKIEGMLLISN